MGKNSLFLAKIGQKSGKIRDFRLILGKIGVGNPLTLGTQTGQITSKKVGTKLQSPPNLKKNLGAGGCGCLSFL